MPDSSELPTEAILVVNCGSRRGKEWYDRATDALAKSGLKLRGAHSCSKPGESIGLIKRAVKDGTPLIIVGGGDGTLSSAAEVLVNSESILGVLPMGTGNAFARDLGIPPDPERAIEILTTGKLARVDLGLANKKLFVNVATVGLTTRIAEGLTGESKRRLGRMVYAFAVARAVALMKPFKARLTTDEGTDEYTTMQFVVGSGRFHAGPFPVTPDAEITDRMLNGYVLATTRKGVLLKYALHLWGGHQVNLPEVHAFSTKEGRLETTPAKRITVDGEISDHTPLDFKVLPSALRVIVPQEF